MALRASHHTVRMRPADSAHDDFALLEELSKPHACLNAGHIAVWVYQQGPLIREIVLSGHAESRTCGSVSSIIIEAATNLGGDVSWMLTAGAAYFRVSEPGLGLPYALGGLEGAADTQVVLSQMVQALQERSAEIGLIHVFEEEWAKLAAFREHFRSRVGSSPAQIVLPQPGNRGIIADYMPVVPGSDADGAPWVFTLEGWDFDDPAYQAVADRHLHCVQRELLRDALRRRRTYRRWLRDLMEQWARRLKWLPEEQAAVATVELPPPGRQCEAPGQPVDAGTFLEEHLADFLDRGQDWPKRLAYYYRREAFNKKSAQFLDTPIPSGRIRVLNFMRATEETRMTTDDDVRRNQRENILFDLPSLLTMCLRYIRGMDEIIRPYQDLRLWQRARRGRPGTEVTEDERKIRTVAGISAQIVVETMIRGWPSFYLDDKRDRAAFDAWAEQCRPHVWSIMARQARKAGVALDILLEDNVTYDVRFNDDLGCTVQPLMLVDAASHAQVHGSRAGASVVVPLWARRASNEVPQAVLALGSTNRQRAQQIVAAARDCTTLDHHDPDRTASLLRTALACHPPEAAKLILREWAERLGRDTASEFERARLIVYAREFCSRLRYGDARPHVDRYLEQEPDPIADAYVMAAMGELVPERDAVAELEDAAAEHRRLLERFKEAAGKDPAELSEAEFESLLRRRRDLLDLVREIQRLGERCELLKVTADGQEKQRRTLINKALRRPGSVREKHPALAVASKRAKAELRQTLETQCLYLPLHSEAMALRYSEVGRTVEVIALFEILHRLAMIDYRLDRAPATDVGELGGELDGELDGELGGELGGELEELLDDPWLPQEAAADLKTLAEELRKGQMDRFQISQVSGGLRDAEQTCLMRIQDRLSEESSLAMALGEMTATRVHITQTIEAKYKAALDMMLGATVAFGRAIHTPWAVLDSQLKEFPEQSALVFDAATRTICVEAPGGRVALLQARDMRDDELDYVAALLADPELPGRLNPYVPPAEAVLALEVEPCPAWRLWRDAMAAVSRELIYVLGNFSYEASLMPELAPAKTEEGEKMDRRMDQLRPKAAPSIDLSWHNVGTWAPVLGSGPRRSTIEIYI